MSENPSKSRYYVFVLNNPWGIDVTEGPLIHINDIGGCKYLTYQIERGENGTVHWQGYLELKNPRTFSSIKKDNDYTARMNFQNRHGTAVQAAEYAQKEDTRIGIGVTEGELSSRQGKRSDLDAVKEFYKNGGSERDGWEKFFGAHVRSHRAFTKYRRLVVKRRNWPMEVRVYWGLTDTGKTRSVYAEFDAEEIYSLPPPRSSGTYWDDYDGQRVVLVDEMYGNRFSWAFLLQLLDRYPFKVPVLGDFVEFTSRIIIFTSNAHPGEWYNVSANIWGPNANKENPFVRRLTEVRAFPSGTLWEPSLEAVHRSISATLLTPVSAVALSNYLTDSLWPQAEPEAAAIEVIDDEPVDNNNNE